MQKEASTTEILMLSDILERIGMEETLRAVQFAAEWNAEVAAESTETNSGTHGRRSQDSPPVQRKYAYGSYINHISNR
jgi:hypothetical protein